MQGSRLGYRPALDGVRACAVLAVLLYHGDVSWLGGGFLGVDAFFVLSGFLITSLLFTEARTGGRVDLRAFWARRARRLLPALFLVLGAVALYAATLAPSHTLDTLRADAWSALGYVANWRFVFSDQSYFEQFAAPSPLRHLWSLAIEEQFYLLWPLIFVGLMKVSHGARAALLVGAVAMAGASFLIMLVLADGGDPSRIYYGTDTRACSILIGAVLALLVTGRRIPDTRGVRTALETAAFLAAGGLIWLWAATPEDARWLYRGGLAGAAVLVAIVLASVSRPRPGPLGRVLSIPPLVWVGVISYGLYLWHWPIYVMLTEERVGAGGTTLLAVRLVCTFAAATASFYLVEEPIRSGAWRGWRIRLTTPVVAGALVFALVAATAAATTQPFERVRPDAVLTKSTRVVVTGDAGASMLASMLRHDARALEVRAAVPRPCAAAISHHSTLYPNPLRTPPCTQVVRTPWVDRVRRERADLVVVFDGTDPYAVPLGDEVFFDPSEENERAALEAAQAELRALAHGGRRVIVIPTPRWEPSPMVTPIEALRRGRWIERWNELLRAAVGGQPRIATMLDVESHLADPAWVGDWLGPELELRREYWRVPTTNAVRTLLVGDSTAMTLALGLMRVADPRELFVVDRAKFNCGSVRGSIYQGLTVEPPGHCTFEQAWATDVARYRPHLVLAYWGWVDLWDHRVDGQMVRFGTPEADELYLQRLELAVSTLTSTGARLVLLTSPYFDGAEFDLRIDAAQSPFSAARVDHWNGLLRTIAARHPDRVTLVDLHAFQSPAGQFTDELAGVQVVDDGVHYSAAGADLVGRWLVPQLLDIARPLLQKKGPTAVKQ